MIAEVMVSHPRRHRAEGHASRPLAMRTRRRTGTRFVLGLTSRDHNDDFFNNDSTEQQKQVKAEREREPHHISDASCALVTSPSPSWRRGTCDRALH